MTPRNTACAAVIFAVICAPAAAQQPPARPAPTQSAEPQNVPQPQDPASKPAPPATPTSSPPQTGTSGSPPGTPENPTKPVTPPPGYVIGPDDVLTVVFWRDTDISRDVVVRPDGMISLPLINDIHAAGLTPEQLRVKLQEAASGYLEEPTASVVVKQIHSRRAYITGQVNRPGPYSLTVPTTVMQLISAAGGLREFADKKNIVILRVEQGRPMSYRFNYEDIVKRRNLRQNIELQPGDTVVVP